MQALAPAFPGCSFAAVAIKGERAALRSLVARRGLTFPVGIDDDGALAALYKRRELPAGHLRLPGGVVQSKALLTTPSLGALRARVARARGGRARPRLEGAGG